MIALDRSLGLLSIAKQQEGDADCVRGDLGCRGWRDGVFVRSSSSPFASLFFTRVSSSSILRSYHHGDLDGSLVDIVLVSYSELAR